MVDLELRNREPGKLPKVRLLQSESKSQLSPTFLCGPMCLAVALWKLGSRGAKEFLALHAISVPEPLLSNLRKTEGIGSWLFAHTSIRTDWLIYVSHVLELSSAQLHCCCDESMSSADGNAMGMPFLGSLDVLGLLFPR